MTSIPDTPDGRLAALVAGRSGVFTLPDAARAGLSERTVQRRVTQGRAFRRHQGVYVLGVPTLDARGEAIAALLACGAGAVLSHASAAALWDLAPWPAVPHITAPGRHDLRGVRTHVAATMPEATRRAGLPTTGVDDLLLALAEDPGDVPLMRTLNEALYQRRTTVERLDTMLRAATGRHGVPVLQALLPHAGELHSKLEDDFHRMLGGAGLPRPQANRRVLGRKVDFWWPQERVVVETDGWAAHGTRTAFETDRDHDAALLAAGIVTMRTTSHALATRPLVVCARLGAVLLRGGT